MIQNTVLKICQNKSYLLNYLSVNFKTNIFKGKGSNMLNTAVTVEEDEFLEIQLNGS